MATVRNRRRCRAAVPRVALVTVGAAAVLTVGALPAVAAGAPAAAPRTAVSAPRAAVSAPRTAAVPQRVTVPAGYVYNPALGARHDYCTGSPDEFPNPAGANADFRGPCARHDLCYDRGRDLLGCDNALLRDLRANCEAVYPAATRGTTLRLCRSTARLYWAVVVIAP